MKKIIITSSLIVMNILVIIGLLVHYNKPNNSYSAQSLSASTIPDSISIMIQSSAGSTTYTKSTSETWPDSTKYHLNANKSYCKNNSTYSLSGSKVLVNLNRADDCYFYFDLGSNVTFSIQLYQNNFGAPQPDLYTNGNFMTVFYLSSNTTYSVCVTNEASPNNCTWKSTSELTKYFDNNLMYSNPISLTREGLTTLYAYLKDSSGNIYGYESDSITVDKTAPTCSINVTSSEINYTANDNYYVYGNGLLKKDGTTLSGTSAPLAVGKYDLEVWDGAGNECKDSITISDKVGSDTKNCTILSGECIRYGSCGGSYSVYNCKTGQIQTTTVNGPMNCNNFMNSNTWHCDTSPYVVAHSCNVSCDCAEMQFSCSNGHTYSSESACTSQICSYGTSMCAPGSTPIESTNLCLSN